MVASTYAQLAAAGDYALAHRPRLGQRPRLAMLVHGRGGSATTFAQGTTPPAWALTTALAGELMVASVDAGGAATWGSNA